MSRTHRFPSVAVSVAVISACVLLTGCGSAMTKPDPMLVGESFDADDIYSRSYVATPARACEAARRALLGQGYVVTRSTAESVEASKNFQPEPEHHMQLDLRVSCVPQAAGTSLVFVSAVQDGYALKKSATSASVGVGALGSLSLPIGSSDDSLVRVASKTVRDGDFYTRFFDRVDYYLPSAPVIAPVMPTVEPLP